jgi:hypothetical protein
MIIRRNIYRDRYKRTRQIEKIAAVKMKNLFFFLPSVLSRSICLLCLTILFVRQRSHFSNTHWIITIVTFNIVSSFSSSYVLPFRYTPINSVTHSVHQVVIKCSWENIEKNEQYGLMMKIILVKSIGISFLINERTNSIVNVKND